MITSAVEETQKYAVICIEMIKATQHSHIQEL